MQFAQKYCPVKTRLLSSGRKNGKVSSTENASARHMMGHVAQSVSQHLADLAKLFSKYSSWSSVVLGTLGISRGTNVQTVNLCLLQFGWPLLLHHGIQFGPGATVCQTKTANRTTFHDECNYDGYRTKSGWSVAYLQLSAYNNIIWFNLSGNLTMHVFQ